MLLDRAAADAGAGVVDHRARRRRRRDGDGVAQPAGRQRLQGVPRRRRPDRAAARRRASRPAIDDVDPTAVVDLAAARRSADRVGSATESIDALPRGDARRAAAPRGRRRAGGVHGDARRRRASSCCARSTRPGCRRRVVVAEQFEPDPARSRRCRSRTRRSRGRWTCCIGAGASSRAPLLAIANDPDADRLGAAIPQPDGSWRRLGGDEIGWLLADHLLDHTSGDDRLVVTTLVSSSLLGDDGRRPRRALRRDVHRVQVDRPHRARPSRAAVRVRLRAGARLPRDAAAARQGRHLGGGAARRGRRRRRRGGHDAAGPPRRPSPPATAATSIAERSVRMEPGGRRRPRCEALQARPARPRSPAARCVDVAAYPEADLLRLDARRRRPGAGPPERHRAEGQALRRSRRRRPGPLLDALAARLSS